MQKRDEALIHCPARLHTLLYVHTASRDRIKLIYFLDVVEKTRFFPVEVNTKKQLEQSNQTNFCMSIIEKVRNQIYFKFFNVLKSAEKRNIDRKSINLIVFFIYVKKNSVTSELRLLLRGFQATRANFSVRHILLLLKLQIMRNCAQTVFCVFAGRM